MRIILTASDLSLINQNVINFSSIEINCLEVLDKIKIRNIASNAFSALNILHQSKNQIHKDEKQIAKIVEEAKFLVDYKKITWKITDLQGLTLESNEVIQHSFPDPYKNCTYLERMNAYRNYPIDSEEYKQSQQYLNKFAEKISHQMCNQNMDNFN